MGYASRAYLREKYLRLKYNMEEFLCITDMEEADQIDSSEVERAIDVIKDSVQAIISELEGAIHD